MPGITPGSERTEYFVFNFPDPQSARNRVIIYIGKFSLKQNLPSNLVFKVAKQLYIEAETLYIETDTSTKF